ncbi:MAG TPA: carboxypeptidase-like regulatory domain-containing protein [Niastella sp.]|nr:carboxypeptidase-like regulatory domain-containing protein [Niastella sp.]
MKQIKIVMIFSMLVFSALFLKAQSKGTVLTGKVITFEERLPIEGATIQVKGTCNISGTMYDGMYAIEIKAGDSVLVFSFDGYETMELPIAGQKREYNVMLKSRPASVVELVSLSFICNDAGKQLLASDVLVHK